MVRLALRALVWRYGEVLRCAVPRAVDFLVQGVMALSARNQLPGKIKDIQIGDIMAHVVVKVGNNLVESVITRNSALELGLKKGDSVKVVVKSTEVMIQKD
jgi:molybdopterin-binding protein